MPIELSPQREKLLLISLAGIQFANILDFMVMMPLGPILMSALGIGTHEFGLLVASYSFSSAASGLLGALFIDRFERKRLLLTMFTLFSLATLACGMAPSYLVLIVARGFAGAFGGILGALVQTIIGDTIPFERRAKASGIISTAFAISTVAGVPLSLWLANTFSWRSPFFFIATMAVLVFALALKTLPRIHGHIGSHSDTDSHPFVAMFAVLRDPNHLKALFFSALILFSSFTIIPYITVYAIGTVHISQHDIPLVYLVGGAATLFSARRIGKWADAAGKVKVYRLIAIGAMLPMLLVTHIGEVPLWLWLICTTTFFVLMPGRMIPAMAIITSAAQAKLRGTFMSLHATVQSLAMGLATTVTGFIISQNNSGQLSGYEWAGYISAAVNLLSIWFVVRIVMHDQKAAPAKE